MLNGCADYRQFLKDELEKRIQSNAAYSLRAFARDIGVTPQQLSFVLNRKKGLSLEAAFKVATRLDLNDDERAYFCDLAQMASARSAGAKQLAELRIARSQSVTDFQSITLDVFKIISDWHHYALLELTTTKGFKSEPEWIAKRLGITSHEVKQAIERLIRLELLEEKKGKLAQTEVNLATTHDVPSEAIQKFNRQILTKAIDALREQDVTERDCTTVTIATDPKKLALAKPMIKEFRRKLAQFLEAGPHEEVYTLSIQLFRLTKKQTKEK